MTYIQKFPKPGPRRRKSARPTGPAEATIQALVIAYLNASGLRYVHVPDCVYRLCAPFSPIPIHQKREISQALKGTPDLIILQDDRVLLLELKRKGGRLRQPQKAWLKGLVHHVPDTAQEAITIIKEWQRCGS